MAVSHSPGRTRDRARVPRNTLNRERVLAAAVDLLDHAGPGEFTMRALARRLGVATMTVYSHFSGKDEIIDAVRVRLLAEAELPARAPADESADPREEIRELCRAVHRLLAGHPSVLRLLAERPVHGDEGTQFADRVLAALLRAGLERAEVARAYTALVQFTVGAALWSQHGRCETVRRAPVPADRFPFAAGLAPELARAARAGGDQFEYGLSALLAGLLEPGAGPPTNGGRHAG